MRTTTLTCERRIEQLRLARNVALVFSAALFLSAAVLSAF